MYKSDYRPVLHICVHYKRLVPGNRSVIHMHHAIYLCICVYMYVGWLVSRPINSIHLHNCTQACLICIYCVITHINGPQIQRQPPKCSQHTAANAVEKCIHMMYPPNDDDNDNDAGVMVMSWLTSGRYFLTMQSKWRNPFMMVYIIMERFVLR